MTIIWGYSPESKLSNSKEIGTNILEVKQVFSALLFKEGISGIVIRVDEVEDQTQVIAHLVVDDESILSESFYPKEAGDFSFKTENLVRPITKIEAGIEIIKGSLRLPTSVIGNGMGFQKVDEKFQPTNHLCLGLII